MQGVRLSSGPPNTEKTRKSAVLQGLRVFLFLFSVCAAFKGVLYFERLFYIAFENFRFRNFLQPICNQKASLQPTCNHKKGPDWGPFFLHIRVPFLLDKPVNKGGTRLDIYLLALHAFPSKSITEECREAQAEDRPDNRYNGSQRVCHV